jgi:hypothetical protein
MDAMSVLAPDASTSNAVMSLKPEWAEWGVQMCERANVSGPSGACRCVSG